MVCPVCLACEAMLHPSPKNPPPVGPLRPGEAWPRRPHTTHRLIPSADLASASWVDSNADPTSRATPISPLWPHQAPRDPAPPRNGEATSSSPFQSPFQDDEDIAAPRPFPKRATSRERLRLPIPQSLLQLAQPDRDAHLLPTPKDRHVVALTLRLQLNHRFQIHDQGPVQPHEPPRGKPLLQ